MASKGVTIPVPLMRRDDRRRAERFVATMPVSVDGHEGVTEDLSSTGLSFIADQPYEIGARVDVVIEYLLDGAQYPLHCQAEVVRVDKCADGFRMGARLAADDAVREIEVENGDRAQAAPQRLRKLD